MFQVQYEFVYDAVLDASRCGNTALPMSRLSQEFSNLKNSKIPKQFAVSVGVLLTNNDDFLYYFGHS